MRARLVLVAVLAAAPAHAEGLNFGALDEHANVVTVTTGADAGLVIGAGYGHAVAIADRPVVLGGDLTLALGAVDVDDFRLRAGALASLASLGSWRLIGGVTAIVRGTRNDIARMIDLGSDVSLVAGRYARRWFGAVELGLDWAMTTHVAPSDTYRMTVYAAARDGWYANAGGTLRAGIQAGVTFGRHDLVLRAGRLADVAGNAPMLPIYGTLMFATRW